MCVCVSERGSSHETVITDSILHLKKDPAVLLSRTLYGGDEEDTDMPAQSAGSDCIQSDLKPSHTHGHTHTHSTTHAHTHTQGEPHCVNRREISRITCLRWIPLDACSDGERWSLYDARGPMTCSSVLVVAILEADDYKPEVSNVGPRGQNKSTALQSKKKIRWHTFFFRLIFQQREWITSWERYQQSWIS